MNTKLKVEDFDFSKNTKKLFQKLFENETELQISKDCPVLNLNTIGVANLQKIARVDVQRTCLDRIYGQMQKAAKNAKLMLAVAILAMGIVGAGMATGILYYCDANVFLSITPKEWFPFLIGLIFVVPSICFIRLHDRFNASHDALAEEVIRQKVRFALEILQ